MSELKTSPNLFLESQELNRFKKFIDTDGFRNFLIQNSVEFGLIRKENESFLNALVQEDIGLTVKINAIKAIDSNGKLISKSTTSLLSVPADSNWYWLKIAYNTTNEELGTFSIDTSGNLVCTSNDAELKTILRGQPNFPSRITFINSSNNLLEYDVLEVVDNQNAILQGDFNAESDLKIAVIGTFTAGSSPLTSDKYIFNYDSCTLTMVMSNTINPPSHTTGTEFIIGRVKSDGINIKIEDKRNEIWKTNSNYFLSNLELSGNPLIGVSQITYDDSLSTLVQNLLKIEWVFTAISYSINLKLNTITISGGSGGKFKSTNFNTLFSDGDFDGWRLYTKSGKFFKIKTSSLIASNIELVMDNISSEEFFSDINSVTPIAQSLIVSPDADEIEIVAIADPASSNNIVDKKFTFPINNSYGKIALNVYDDTDTSYNIKYRYIHIKDYSPEFVFPNDVVGFYSETQFDVNGNLVAVPVRTPYTSDPDNGYIPLKLNPNSYSAFTERIDLGDKLGVDVSLLTNASPLVELEVGTQRQYQYWSDGDDSVSNDALTLASDLFINLKKTNFNGDPCRNGNFFRLHFKQKVILNGFTIRIVTDYVNPTTFTELKAFTSNDELFLNSSEEGLFILSTFEGTNWIVNSTNETSVAYEKFFEQVKHDAVYTVTDDSYTIVPDMTIITPDDGITRKLLIQYKASVDFPTGATTQSTLLSFRLYNATTLIELDFGQVGANKLTTGPSSIDNIISLIALEDVGPNEVIEVHVHDQNPSDPDGTLRYNKLVITEQK